MTAFKVKFFGDFKAGLDKEPFVIGGGEAGLAQTLLGDAQFVAGEGLEPSRGVNPIGF